MFLRSFRHQKTRFFGQWHLATNPAFFSNADYIQAVEQSAEALRIDIGIFEDDQRRIVVSEVPEFGATEEVSTSEPLTSRMSISTSHATSFSSVMDEIGLLQATLKRTVAKRSLKPIQSSVLTSLKNVFALKGKGNNKKIDTEKCWKIAIFVLIFVLK